MKKYIKANIMYKNALGMPVEITKKLNISELDNLLSLDNVRVISVNGIPGAYFYRKNNSTNHSCCYC